jgi:hypothetical protein
MSDTANAIRKMSQKKKKGVKKKDSNQSGNSAGSASSTASSARPASSPDASSSAIPATQIHQLSASPSAFRRAARPASRAESMSPSSTSAAGGHSPHLSSPVASRQASALPYSHSPPSSHPVSRQHSGSGLQASSQNASRQTSNTAGHVRSRSPSPPASRQPSSGPMRSFDSDDSGLRPPNQVAAKSLSAEGRRPLSMLGSSGSSSGLRRAVSSPDDAAEAAAQGQQHASVPAINVSPPGSPSRSRSPMRARSPVIPEHEASSSSHSLASRTHSGSDSNIEPPGSPSLGGDDRSVQRKVTVRLPEWLGRDEKGEASSGSLADQLRGMGALAPAAQRCVSTLCLIVCAVLLMIAW